MCGKRAYRYEPKTTSRFGYNCPKTRYTQENSKVGLNQKKQDRKRYAGCAG